MDIIIERIDKFNKELVALLFVQAGESRNIEPAPGFFGDPANILLTAYTDGTPAGFLYAYILSGLKTPYPKMFLYSIDVFAGFQRRKIATKLIAELKKISLKNGCSEIFVMTNRNNEPAMNLYQNTGAKNENIDDVLFIYERETFTR